MSQGPGRTGLEGRKVRLRPLAEPDAPALWDAVEASRADLRKRYDWPGSALAPRDEAAFIKGLGEADLALGVEEARTGRLVGVAGAGGESPDGEPFAWAGARASFDVWIASDRRNRGYATEAGRMLLDHAFRRLGAHRVYARIDPANRPGRKVLQKLGFRYEGRLREERRLNGRWVHQECWGLLRTEWKR